MIEKIYDYITEVTIKQGKLLPEKVLYGDGSRWNNNKIMFHAVYEEIKNYLNTQN